jgi:hypothetical protein
MEIITNIVSFGLLVLFASLLMLWRRADDWEGIPFPQRFVRAMSASRNWWLLYSFAQFCFLMFWAGESFGKSISAVLVAIALAVVFAIARIPK